MNKRNNELKGVEFFLRGKNRKLLFKSSMLKQDSMYKTRNDEGGGRLFAVCCKSVKYPRSVLSRYSLSREKVENGVAYGNKYDVSRWG